MSRLPTPLLVLELAEQIARAGEGCHHGRGGFRGGDGLGQPLAEEGLVEVPQPSAG